MDCKGIAADADGEHGLLTKKFHYKLKDTLEALKKSSEDCESCAFIVRHLPAHYIFAYDRSGLIPKDGDVILKRQYADLERIGVWAGNLLGDTVFQISTRYGRLFYLL
jgi:hypothetical protein